jgi:S-adenosylmethionine decarboxylase
MKALGVHCIAEFYNCDAAILNNHKHIRKVFVEAAKDSGATIVKVAFHKFNPWGVSGVVVIAESHLTIHTWPEYGYAAVDIFTCGDLINNNQILEKIKKGLGAKSCSTSVIQRGILAENQKSLFN